MKPQLNKDGRDERAAWSIADCWAFGQAMGVLLLLVIFVLLALVSFAKADALPDAMIGKWCFLNQDSEGKLMVYDRPGSLAPAWEKCKEGDGWMVVRSDGYTAHEASCRFTSVKRTGERTAPHTKARPQDLIPVVRITARCVMYPGATDGDRWTEKFELSIGKAMVLYKTP